jgi:hypothetical protein
MAIFKAKFPMLLHRKANWLGEDMPVDDGRSGSGQPDTKNSTCMYRHMSPPVLLKVENLFSLHERKWKSLQQEMKN